MFTLQLVSFLALSSSSAPADYTDCSGVVVHAQTAEQAKIAASAATPVLSDHPGVHPFYAIYCGNARATLDAAGISYRQLSTNVQADIVAERARVKAAQAATVREGDGWYAEFKTLEQIDARITKLETSFGDVVRVHEIGQSVEGRPIRALHLSHHHDDAGVRDDDRKAVLFIGTQHAREWISPMVVMYIAEKLASGAGVRDGSGDVLDEVDVHIVPVVNPDGYAWTWNPKGDRYWRKNRRDSIGVDLNRNWAHGWGDESGASSDPQSEIYFGTAPFSEPETDAVRQLVATTPGIVGFIDFHSFSQLVLYPPGFVYAPRPMGREHECMGKAIADDMHSVHDRFYWPMPSILLYPATGVSDDWAAVELGALSFAIELRPGTASNEDFVISPEHILPAGEENLVAAIDVARWAAGHHPESYSCEPDPYACADACYVQTTCSTDPDANYEECVAWCNIDGGHLAEEKGNECESAYATYTACVAGLTCEDYVAHDQWEADAPCSDEREAYSSICWAPPSGCGWYTQGYYYCGGEGEDPSGQYPRDCPEGLVDQAPGCTIQNVGCCDANDNAWFCIDDGEELINYQITCGAPGGDDDDDDGDDGDDDDSDDNDNDNDDDDSDGEGEPSDDESNEGSGSDDDWSDKEDKVDPDGDESPKLEAACYCTSTTTGPHGLALTGLLSLGLVGVRRRRHR